MNSKQIATKLKYFGITQSEAAKICGVTQAQISFFLSGDHKSRKLMLQLTNLIKSQEQQLKSLTNR